MVPATAGVAATTTVAHCSTEALVGPEAHRQNDCVPLGVGIIALNPWFGPAPGYAASPAGFGWSASTEIHREPMLTARCTAEVMLVGWMAHPVIWMPPATAVAVICPTGTDSVGTVTERHPSTTAPDGPEAHRQNDCGPGGAVILALNPWFGPAPG